MQSLWYHLICWCLTFMRNFWKSDSLSPSLLVVYMKQHMAIVTVKPVLLLLLLLYNSLCRVLAFSANSFYLLSRTRVFQFGTFDFCISFLTSSSLCLWSSYWPSWNGFPGVYCLDHSCFLHPFDVTKLSQSLCSNEVYSQACSYLTFRVRASWMQDGI